MSLDLESPYADAGAHAGRANAKAGVGKVRGKIELFDEFELEGEAEGPKAGAEANFSGGDLPQGSASAKADAGRARGSIGDGLLKLKGEARGPNADAHAGFDLRDLQASASAKVEAGKVEYSTFRGMAKTEARGPNADARAGCDLGVIPQASASAKCGVVNINSSYLNGIVKTESRGPNAGVRAGVGVRETGAMAKAELLGVTGQAGPVVGAVGLSATTGARIGIDGFEGKVLGTGVKCIHEDGEFESTVSLFGSKVGFKFPLKLPWDKSGSH